MSMTFIMLRQSLKWKEALGALHWYRLQNILVIPTVSISLWRVSPIKSSVDPRCGHLISNSLFINALLLKAGDEVLWMVQHLTYQNIQPI